MSDKKYKEWLKEMEDVSKDDILEFYYNLYFKYEKQKEVLDKIKEIIKASDDCLINYDEMDEKIHKLLEEIE